MGNQRLDHLLSKERDDRPATQTINKLRWPPEPSRPGVNIRGNSDEYGFIALFNFSRVFITKIITVIGKEEF